MKNRRLKKLLMLLLLFPISFMGQNAYVEWNVGVAYIDEFELPCPGTSVLFGNTFTYVLPIREGSIDYCICSKQGVPLRALKL